MNYKQAVKLAVKALNRWKNRELAFDANCYRQLGHDSPRTRRAHDEATRIEQAVIILTQTIMDDVHDDHHGGFDGTAENKKEGKQLTLL